MRKHGCKLVGSQYCVISLRANHHATASFSETLGDTDAAIQAYENVLRHETWSVPAMSGIASILRDRDQYALAIDYLRSITKIDQTNGEVWSHLGKLAHSSLLIHHLINS